MNSLRLKLIGSSLGIWMVLSGVVYAAGYDKDPIKSTQTDTVPVTEELLKQEGQAGPASPTFKLRDGPQFLGRQPYGSDVEMTDLEEYKQEKKDSSEWWEDWVSGDEKEPEVPKDEFSELFTEE